MRLVEIFDAEIKKPTDVNQDNLPRELMDCSWHAKKIEQIMKDTGCTMIEAIGQHEKNYKKYLKGLKRGFMSIKRLTGLSAMVLGVGGGTHNNGLIIAGSAVVYIMLALFAKQYFDNYGIRGAKKLALEKLKDQLTGLDAPNQ